MPDSTTPAPDWIDRIVSSLDADLQARATQQPHWHVRQTITLAAQAMRVLQSTIAAGTYPSVTWQQPRCEVDYPVAWDWQEGRMLPFPPEPATPETTTPADIRARWVDTWAFHLLTGGRTVEIEGGVYQPLARPDEPEGGIYQPLARPDKPEEQEPFVPYVFGANLWLEGEVRGKPYRVSPQVEFLPLTVDFDDSRAYYPMIAELVVAPPMDAQEWDAEDQAALWEVVWEAFGSILRVNPADEEKPVTKRKPRKRAGADDLPSLLAFPSDRIHKGVIEGLSQVQAWQPDGGFFRAFAPSRGKRNDFSMSFGFRTDPGETVWKFLLSHGEAAIKAHYALHARCYQQTGGEPGQQVQVSIVQFCRDLGYKEHHKGGYKRERKVEARRLLEVLTSVEIAVEFTPKGKNAKTRRLRGPLWARGLVAEEQDQYGDLLGSVRVGDPELWDPVGFTFSPGPWFADPVWRRQNEYLGRIGAGLMHLQPDNDQAAIRIGGYLGTLARFDQYRTRRIRVSTLLERIGMAKLYPQNPTKLQAKIEAGLRKLVEVEVFTGWRYTDADAELDEPDMDNPEELASLADYGAVPWRRQVIEVEWPVVLDPERERLESAQEKARRKTASKALKASAVRESA